MYILFLYLKKKKKFIVNNILSRLIIINIIKKIGGVSITNKNEIRSKLNTKI